MKLTWEDIEAHRSAATPAQWRRMQAYFRDGKSIMEIAADEGQLEAKTSLVLGLGRGCIAVLNSMLQRPVRIPTESKTLVSELQGLLRQQAGEMAASSEARAEGAATDVETCDVGDEFAPNHQDRESAPHEDRSLCSSEDCLASRSEPSMQTGREIGPRMRVEGHNRVGHDVGKVEKVAGDVAVDAGRP